MPTAAEIHDGLDHPVIDADGHGIEYLPWFRDLLRDEGGPGAVDAWNVVEHGASATRALDTDAKRSLGVFRVSWWGLPAENTLDRATAMLPGLLYDRLDELGIDVAVVYPTYGLTVMGLDDPDLRVAAARAFNTYYAQAYAPFRDRLEPVAIVPTYAPDEAIAVLDQAVGTLGLRAVMCTGLVQRPLPGAAVPRGARWVDALGLDSAHDYDPLWQRFVDSGVTPTFHSTGMGWGSRTSPTSYVANHLGSFGAAGEALCRALFLGGVMARFPTLRFAFLEGGVAWAATLCGDLVGHFEKRHGDAIGQYDPARLDRGQLRALMEQHGAAAVVSRLDALDDALHMLSEPDEDAAQIDEFAACGARSPADIRAVFERQCFFGCEADDPMWALAFAPEYAGTRLGAMFASDLGHWDVPDARSVLPEAWEQVEHGRVSPADFRAFTYDHALALWGSEMFANTRAGNAGGGVMTHAWRTGTVDSGGEDIYYEVVGADDVPAIVLTHGAGGCHAIWYQQAPVLADAGYRVVTWDCRGFGNSTFRTGADGCPAAVADMVVVMDTLGIRRAHLAGQSMGGWWVTAFALAHADRTQTLTLSNTVGGLWTDEITEHFAKWAGSAAARRDDGVIGSHSVLSPTFGERDPACAFLYEQINTFQTPPMMEVGKALMGSHVEHAALDATGVPVLVITSNEDVLFPAELVTDSARRLANATIVEIDGAGHSAYFERPDEYNDALLGFIGETLVTMNIVTTEQIDFFATNGFVVVDDLVTPAELDVFEPLLTAAVEVRSRPDERPLEERSPYQQSFQQCINLWEDNPPLRVLTFHQRVGQAAGELLGVDGVRLWHDQALYKRAHGRETDPHQDQPYWPIAETDTVTAWIPMQGSTMANGAMGYLPGSHRVGLRKFQNIFSAEDASEFMQSPEIAGIEPVYVEVPRGSVAFHHGLTVHMAKPNTTDLDRAVHTMIMFADGSTRGSKMFHFSVDRDSIEVGAPIQGPATPILWPRAPDDDPPVPVPMTEQVRQLAPIGLLPSPIAD